MANQSILTFNVLSVEQARTVLSEYKAIIKSQTECGLKFTVLVPQNFVAEVLESLLNSVCNQVLVKPHRITHA